MVVPATVWARLRRVGYRGAYALARAWWWVRRPRTSGALVALWCGHDLLMLRTSYRQACSLPGGFVRAGEDPRDAATRELHEELGIRLDRTAVREAWRETRTFESRTDTVTIFESRIDAAPQLRVDAGEVAWVGWVEPAAALRLPLLPHLEAYLRRVVQDGAPPAG